MHSLACAAILLLSLSSANAASADEDDAGQPAPAAASTPASSVRETRWYGWQTMLVDIGSVGLGVAAGRAAGTGTGFAVALTGYAVGAPIVHLAHGEGGDAGVSVGLRLGLPLVAGLIGYGIGAASFQGCAPGDWFCSRDWSAGIGAVLGAGVGAVGAVILDWSLLGRERVPPGATSSRGIHWSPLVAVTPKGEPSMGVAGSF
jgi:hypothetical protein